ncbi:uncharacterized protein BDW43DRAFT_259375 [Aspergillus alliaceus]|uniref:uncharacterized protein n=1 Tax=Petromyces alliaceus TaxID=209559 RepID=UPI0012A4DF44|nr:uncharacterized protein BDW43DRAFT_259375 [Aspergillus alliaceus]KAB8239832.1 hypothetical protein BDW43DRAFT_259375 [Aspergillus alliaceus]
MRCRRFIPVVTEELVKCRLSFPHLHVIKDKELFWRLVAWSWGVGVDGLIIVVLRGFACEGIIRVYRLSICR